MNPLGSSPLDTLRYSPCITGWEETQHLPLESSGEDDGQIESSKHGWKLKFQILKVWKWAVYMLYTTLYADIQVQYNKYVSQNVKT